MTRLVRLSMLTAAATGLLIVLGGVTRSNPSGAGCGNDWPLCDGGPFPPLDGMAIVEYLHRASAVLVALLVIATAIQAWLTVGKSARTRFAASVATGLILVQGGFGAAETRWELPGSATTHLILAMLFVAATLLTAVLAAAEHGAPSWLAAFAPRAGQHDRGFATLALTGAVVTLLLIVSGGVTSSGDAALSCDAWPWCSGGTIVPDHASDRTWLELSHRTAAIVGAATVALVVWQAMRRPVSRSARRMAEVALGVTVVQVFVGGGYVVTDGSRWLDGAHLVVSAMLWAAMFGVAVAARRPAEAQAALPAGGEVGLGPLLPAATFPASAGSLEGVQAMPQPLAVGTATAALAPILPLPDVRGLIALSKEYIALTKPGILTLLLATTLGGMLAGAAGLPPVWSIVATLIGGALAAGGANALNCYIDRDIDALMSRTKKRGTVTGVIPPRAALTFGLTLSVSAVLLLGLAVNWLAAGLALLGNVYYVLIYTKLLKRRTPQNIVIGGAAGAMPPVVGWAAATGSVSVAAVLMFAIIYYWTPPHFWALALLKQGEYGRAAVPMLPNVRGEEETRWQVLLYTLLLAAVALMLVPFGMDWIYLIGAVVLNGIFVWYAVRLYRSPSKALARRTFFYSLWYLAFIFAAMVADRLILA